MEKFTNRKRVAIGFLVALLGVLAYCVVVSPLIHRGPYLESVAYALKTIGLGLGGTTVIIGVIWVAFISFTRSRD